jgi:hypothetical protein
MSGLERILFIGIAVFCLTLSLFTHSSNAATRTTPVTVMNDSASALPVTGAVTVSNIGNYFKPVGITTAKIASTATYYAKSVLCSTEYANSRICTSAELINSPGKFNSIAGVWIMPTISIDPNMRKDISGVYLTDYYPAYGMILQNNELYGTNGGGPYSVLCCSP